MKLFEKYRKVKFSNSSFGIKRSFLYGGGFYDLNNSTFHWTFGDKFFSHCMGSEKVVDEVMVQVKTYSYTYCD